MRVSPEAHQASQTAEGLHVQYPAVPAPPVPHSEANPGLMGCSSSRQRAKSALGLRPSGTRCLIASVWLVISLLGITVPSPRLGCFNVILPALRLNIPLTVSSSNLGDLCGHPSGRFNISRPSHKCFCGQSPAAAVWARHIALPGLYYHSCAAACRAACHLAWAGSGALSRHFCTFSDTTHVAIANSWAPRTLVRPNLYSSSRPSVSGRPFQACG